MEANASEKNIMQKVSFAENLLLPQIPPDHNHIAPPLDSHIPKQLPQKQVEEEVRGGENLEEGFV